MERELVKLIPYAIFAIVIIVPALVIYFRRKRKSRDQEFTRLYLRVVEEYWGEGPKSLVPWEVAQELKTCQLSPKRRRFLWGAWKGKVDSVLGQAVPKADAETLGWLYAQCSACEYHEAQSLLVPRMERLVRVFLEGVEQALRYGKRHEQLRIARKLSDELEHLRSLLEKFGVAAKVDLAQAREKLYRRLIITANSAEEAVAMIDEYTSYSAVMPINLRILKWLAKEKALTFLQKEIQAAPDEPEPIRGWLAEAGPGLFTDPFEWQDE